MCGAIPPLLPSTSPCRAKHRDNFTIYLSPLQHSIFPVILIAAVFVLTVFGREREMFVRGEGILIYVFGTMIGACIWLKVRIQVYKYFTLNAGVNDIYNMALDFNNICRLCMQDEDSLLPLFEVENGLPAKIEAISACIKVSCNYYGSSVFGIMGLYIIVFLIRNL
jgi:hypothetical protein